MRGWGDVTCIRCGEAPAVDDTHMCGHCRWAVRAEITSGMSKLETYLRKVAAFQAWCREHGRAAA